jgi:transcriptional regulator with XRE-family HTH domain
MSEIIEATKGAVVPVKRTRLAARRKVVGFSQEMLAERLQVDRTTVVRWERGECDPQPWKRADLAQALQVSVEQLDELLTGEIQATADTDEEFASATSGCVNDVIVIPGSFWQRPTVTDALRKREMGRFFALVQQYTGASQTRIGIAIGWAQGKVSDAERGVSDVKHLAVFEQIADGLKFPDSARVILGLAARAEPSPQPGIAEPRKDFPANKISPREVVKSVAPAVHARQGRRLIEALDVIGNDNLSGIADSLGDLVDHYAQTICMIPPAEVYEDLLSVRSYAGNVAEYSGGAVQRTDVALSAGWLSGLLAVAACDMGDHATARVWCSDAERRSHDARHPELSAWATLTRAMIAFYQGQTRQSVSLAAKGQRIAPIGTVIHAKLATHEMRAAAMIGDASRVADARRYAGTAIAALPPEAPVTGAFSINLAEDPPYTATSLLFIGEFGEAISATNRVIQQVYSPEKRQRGENPSGYARSLLILGLAQAGVGQIDEAAASGKAALSGSRPAWPTMVLAGKLDQVLARDYTEARGTVEYHNLYSEAASRRVAVAHS